MTAAQDADLVCSCCGATIANNLEENSWYGEVPYPGDTGTGLCWTCGGDPEAKSPKERLGSVVTAFVDARIQLVAERLSKDNRQRFFAMSYEDQADLIMRLVEKGVIA